MSIHSSSRRAEAGRPTLALGIALALLLGLFAPIVLSPRAAAAADDRDDAGWVTQAVDDITQNGGRDRDPAGVDPGTGDDGIVYTTSDLNLRIGPSVGYAVIVVMPPGAEVTLTGSDQAGFTGIRYGESAGWAWTEFLSASPQPAAEPEAIAEPAVVAEPAAPVNVGGDVVSIIYAAAAAYGQDGNALLAVAQCESGLNPGAYNASGASGLFQFLPGTWASTPYAGSSVFDPWASANAAAWMWSVGRRGEWVC